MKTFTFLRKEAEMATIEDVAREAGVSIATVSRIIHNSNRVLPETRRKVEEVIARLDYHPNRLARQFRTQQTMNILVLLPEPENSFYYEIISGIENVADSHGYHVLMAAIHNEPAREAYFFECLQQKQVDGIISFSAGLAPDKLLAFSEQFPVVLTCRYYEDLQIPNVTIDNRKASCDITRYLLNLGHKKLCCLTGSTDILLYRDRLDGFCDAMRERDLPVHSSMIIRSDATIQGGYDSTERLIASGADFTGLVACGDTMAIGAIRALRDAGKKVPSDVAVTGFDDIELSSLYSPSLTTVRQPKRQIGIRSMEKLLDLMAGKKPAIQQEVLRYELVIRESTGNYIG